MFKMKGSSFYGKKVNCTPLQQKKGDDKKQKQIAGEATGKVKKDSKGNEYAIFGEGDPSMTNYYAGNVGVLPGDTIFSGTAPFVGTGDDKYIMGGGDYKVEETKSSKNRKTGPKSYKITGDAQ